MRKGPVLEYQHAFPMNPATAEIFQEEGGTWRVRICGRVLPKRFDNPIAASEFARDMMIGAAL